MHTVLSKDGTKIAYDKTGQGPALILVAGAFSYRKFPGQLELAKALSSQYTVYNYDRRGRGDSGDAPSYAIEREIEDLDAMIEAAGGSAYVWGLSSGAVLALEAAASGSPITRLALHEPPFIVNEADPKPPSDFTDYVGKLIAEDRRAEAIKYFMTKGMGAPSFVIPMMRIMPGVWSRLMAVAHTLPYDAALLKGYIGGQSLPQDKWTNVTIPTLVLEGTESPASLRHAAQETAEVLPNAKLISKKGLGHTKKLHTAMITRELTSFFAG
ncbi:Pimeloyl-ACP methyl ester carboxylesterase [Paenibacillus catalpae]|uniref:Pimeloyl-ACP methyl ester carboxylesterase n=1 Tax=Paenibacillus catalpae TaxID=1045775 RepID=A0A1I1WRH5_9BACL|nr:alpha/beta hydrolase [Paenibacillus catalpae]SFD97767.1 Pimeloyl-ACP methyl ester carboxylesterase [Paenibacillus catalpae]